MIHTVSQLLFVELIPIKIAVIIYHNTNNTRTRWETAKWPIVHNAQMIDNYSIVACRPTEPNRRPPKMGAPCGGGWALQCSACRYWNDHQPPGSSYVSDTALF